MHGVLLSLTLSPPSLDLSTIVLMCSALEVLNEDVGLDVFGPYKTAGAFSKSNLSNKLFSRFKELTTKSMVVSCRQKVAAKTFFGVRPARLGVLVHVHETSDPAFAHLGILSRAHLELDKLAHCFEPSHS